MRQVLVRTIPADKGMCEVVSGIETGMRLANPLLPNVLQDKVR